MAAPTPPELLRELLEEDRAAGLSFDQAWAEEVEYVLRRCSDSWRPALEDLRHVWKAGWDSAPGPPAVTLDLADDAREDERIPSPA